LTILDGEWFPDIIEFFFSPMFCRQFSFADALKQQPPASAESPGGTAAPTAAATAARIAKIRRARADQTVPPSANEKLPPTPANEKPALPPVNDKLPPSAAVPAVHRVKKERAKLEQLGPSPVRSGLNKISAATFAHIGRSGEEEKYVMGSGGEDSNTSRQEVVQHKYSMEYTGTK
jgi:hypothetical protein